MADLNTAAFTGRLTRDPETKSPRSQNGKAFVVMSVAVNGYKDDDCMFLDCMVFGKSASYLAQDALDGRGALKGDMLSLSGYLSQDRWEDKTSGQKRSKVKLMVQGVSIVRTRPEGSERNAGRTSGESIDARPEAPF